jgi:hypothetical protein
MRNMNALSIFCLLSLCALINSTVLTLNYQQELYVVFVQICTLSTMTMNFTLDSDPAPVDFMTYAGSEPAECDPNNIVYTNPHSDLMDYYSSFSCINTGHCRINMTTAAIITGPTCFAFYNRYYKGPVTIYYNLNTACDRSLVNLGTISITPWTIHGTGDVG